MYPTREDYEDAKSDIYWEGRNRKADLEEEDEEYTEDDEYTFNSWEFI